MTIWGLMRVYGFHTEKIERAISLSFVVGVIVRSDGLMIFHLEATIVVIYITLVAPIPMAD
jgi:hypothetical protein